MDERLNQASALIKAKRYSEARAVLIKLNHPTAQKWLQQLDQIAPALPDSETKILTQRVLLALTGVMLFTMVLIAIYAITIIRGRSNDTNADPIVALPTVKQLPTFTSTATSTKTPTLTITPSLTATPKPTSTFTTSPTITLSATITNTQIPTATLTPSKTPTLLPTNTPEYGLFNSPAPMGIAVSRVADLTPDKITATVLDVRFGNDADNLAKTGLLIYQPPIQGQEYLAVKVRLNVVEADPNKVYSLYPSWHLTLRYTENGSDVPAEVGNLLAEGYPPLGGTAWVFFLIRKGSKALLYFQPNLAITERFGYRTSGAYFSLGNS